MSKVVLDTISSGYLLTKVNENFDKIETALNDKVLFRNPSGEPNTMDSTLDMNGQKIINLAAPTTPSSPARLQDLTAAVVGTPNASLVTFTPTSGISATNVQGALEEVYLESGFTQIGTGAQFTSAQRKLREFAVSPEDFDDGVLTDQQLVVAAYAALAAAGGGMLQLNRIYDISSTIVAPGNTHTWGPRWTGFRLLASGFTNTSLTTPYVTSAVAIDASGLTVAPWTIKENVSFEGFKIYAEAGAMDRNLIGILTQNSRNVKIHRVEISDFPVGKAIVGNTLYGDWAFTENYLHDFYTNTTAWPVGIGLPRPQSTGIELDQSRINSVPTFGGKMNGNTIVRFTFGAAAIAAYGFETDGVNIAHYTTSGTDCSYNLITDCGEGIDTYGYSGTFTGNKIYRSYLFGYKLIHGAKRNTIKGGIVEDFGLAGVVVSGSTIVGTTDADRNHIDGLIITSPDYLGAWAANSTTCIKIQNANDSLDPSKVRDTLITNVICSTGANGKYALIDDSHGSGNLISNFKVIPGASMVKRVVISNGASIVRFDVPTGAKMYRSTNQSITTGTVTKILFDATAIDRLGELDVVTNNRYNAKSPGLKKAKLHLRFAAIGAAGVKVTLAIRKNGTDVSQAQLASSASSDQTFSVEDLVMCEEGDYIDFTVRQDSGATYAITGVSQYTYANIEDV